MSVTTWLVFRGAGNFLTFPICLWLKISWKKNYFFSGVPTHSAPKVGCHPKIISPWLPFSLWILFLLSQYNMFTQIRPNNSKIDLTMAISKLKSSIILSLLDCGLLSDTNFLKDFYRNNFINSCLISLVRTELYWLGHHKYYEIEQMRKLQHVLFRIKYWFWINE